MKKTSTFLMLALTLALLAGCSASSVGTGSARFAVSVPQPLSSSIARVAVTSSATDIPAVSVDLAPSNGVWGGIIGNIPAGPDRSFLAQAFDSSGALLFQGSTSGVTIAENQTALIAITLQQVNPPPPFDNEAPLIDSLVASSTTVPPGGFLSLVATARDPNPSDTLSYTWSATAGSFSSPSAASTSWTAPASTGIQTLTFTVTDSRGLSSSIVLAVHVTQSGAEGDAQLSISFNCSPRVVSLSATPTQLAIGQPTAVSVLTSDPDGDSLSYSWSATCAGSWVNASSSSAQFTPSLLPAGACNNCRLTVSVSDGRGGLTTGSVALCVRSSPPTPHLPPVIIRSYRSSDTATAGQVLTYEVVASDPQGSALSFSWAANTGSLGTPTHSASHSRVTWTAPSCVSGNTSPTITATVTSAFNLTATRSFAVTGLPACTTSAWTSTGSMASSRRQHTMTLLSNGKVLVVGGFDTGAPLATAEVYDPASGTWSATGAMSEPRVNHTATLLPNGKVLVAGGYNFNSDYLSTAEVYDPASGTWSVTDPMAVPHSSHTATLLPNGKVLVAGGYNPSRGYLSTAEVYDPASGTWSTTGSMAAARAVHTATLLPNGRILVTGGNGLADYLSTAEVYDSASGTWSSAGSMGEPRYNHNATLMPNGRVLVAGGTSFGDNLSTAEVYDPASGTWSPTGSMAIPRGQPTSTLLPSGKVLVVGGATRSSATARAEVYDPASGTWSAVDSMTEGRASHTATLLLNGKVLVAGGESFRGTLATAEVYGPDSNPWSPTGSMASTRWLHTATLLPNGKVLAAGGYSSTEGYLATAEVYDPVSGTWIPTGTMAHPRYDHRATLLPNGKVLVSGGVNSSGHLAAAEVYDPASGTWSVTGSMISPHANHTSTLLPNGKVLVAGGIDTAAAEVYDPASGTWSPTGSMAEPRWYYPATLLPDGRVLVVGGQNWNGALAAVEVYDPATGTWSAVGFMSSPRFQHTATLLPNGKVLVAGGATTGGPPLTAAEVYDPATGTWSATSSLPEPRQDFTATLLLNGKVLVAGGYSLRDDGSTGPIAAAVVYDPTSGTWSSAGSMTERRFSHSATLLLNGKVLVTGGINDGPLLLTAEVYDPASGP